MRINLNVPFSDKDLAKRRGAKWDNTKKTWYVENHNRLDFFLKWIPERLLKPTQSESLKVPEHIVTQPRSTRLKKKKRT